MPADFAVAAYLDQRAQGLSVGTGASDSDFGFLLQPSGLAVEQDMELSTRFTYSE